MMFNTTLTHNYLIPVIFLRDVTKFSPQREKLKRGFEWPNESQNSPPSILNIKSLRGREKYGKEPAQPR